MISNFVEPLPFSCYVYEKAQNINFFLALVTRCDQCVSCVCCFTLTNVTGNLGIHLGAKKYLKAPSQF